MTQPKTSTFGPKDLKIGQTVRFVVEGTIEVIDHHICAAYVTGSDPRKGSFSGWIPIEKLLPGRARDNVAAAYYEDPIHRESTGPGRKRQSASAGTEAERVAVSLEKKENFMAWGDKGEVYDPSRCVHRPGDGCMWCCRRCNLDYHFCPDCGTISDHYDSPCAPCDPRG